MEEAGKVLDFFLLYREFDYPKSDIERYIKIKNLAPMLEYLAEQGLIKITREEQGEKSML